MSGRSAVYFVTILLLAELRSFLHCPLPSTGQLLLKSHLGLQDLLSSVHFPQNISTSSKRTRKSSSWLLTWNFFFPFQASPRSGPLSTPAVQEQGVALIFCPLGPLMFSLGANEYRNCRRQRSCHVRDATPWPRSTTSQVDVGYLCMDVCDKEKNCIPFLLQHQQ